MTFKIIAFPFIFLSSLIYGVIIGIIGSTVNFCEVQRQKIREEIAAITKYPKWREDEYKNRALFIGEQRKEKDVVESEFRRGRRAPRMAEFILLQMIIGSAIFFPFLFIRGIILGPILAYKQSYKSLEKFLNSKGGAS